MWLSFADSAAAKLVALLQTSLRGLLLCLPLSFGEPHTSPKKVCSQTPLFFLFLLLLLFLLSLLQERQEKQEKQEGQEFSILNFQFPLRVHIARRVQGLVLILLRSLQAVNEEAKSKA